MAVDHHTGSWKWDGAGRCLWRWNVSHRTLSSMVLHLDGRGVIERFPSEVKELGLYFSSWCVASVVWAVVNNNPMILAHLLPPFYI